VRLKAVRNGITVKLLAEIVELMRRRALLATLGGVLPVSIAGCLGNGDDDSADEEQEDDTGEDDTEPEEEDDEGEEEDNDQEDGADEGEGDEQEDEDDEEEEDHPEINEEIGVTDDGFDPSLAIVDRGEVVGWMPEESSEEISFYHTANGTQTRVPIETEAIDETTTQDDPVVFEGSQAGVYDYYHSEAEEDGVVGSIIVGDVTDTTQPGLSVPSTEIPEAARTKLKQLNEEAAEVLDIQLQEPPARETDIQLSADFEVQLTHKQTGGTVTWTATDSEYEVALYHEDVPVVLEPEQEETDGEEDEEPETEPRQHRVPEGVEPFSKTLSPGEEVLLELTEPGVYDWYCQKNESDGVVGSIIVGEEGEDDQPGLQEPDETVPEQASEVLSELNERARLTFVVESVNEVITALNQQEDESISVLNSYIESDETVSYLTPVSAETPEEATAEAERLRNVRNTITNEILDVVPREANRQVFGPALDPDDIETPDDARQEADELEEEESSDVYGEAPTRLREAADFTELLEGQLTSLAEELESITEEN